MAALLVLSSVTALRLVAPCGWRAPPLGTRCRWPRASAAGEDVDIPRDLRELSLEARGAMRSAALSGLRGMLIDAAVPTLDPALKAFKPPLLARFAVECARELRSLASLRSDLVGSADLGRIVVLVPGLACAVEANTLASGGEEEEQWRRAQADAGRTDASGRIEVTSLGMAGEPSPADPVPAAVVVVGLLSSSDPDDRTVATVRQWLRLASGIVPSQASGEAPVEAAKGGADAEEGPSQPAGEAPPAAAPRPPPPLTLGLNLRCGALRELSDFVTVCVLVPYAIVRRAKPAGPISLGGADVEQAKLLLYRVHPAPFRVLVAPPGGDGAASTYEEVVAMEQRPSMERIADLVESRVAEMQSRAQAESTPSSKGGGVKDSDESGGGINGEEERRLAAQRALSSVFTNMEWDAPQGEDAAPGGAGDASTDTSMDVDVSGDVPSQGASAPAGGDISSPAAAAAAAAGMSVVSLSYDDLDDEMRLYASASSLRISCLGAKVAQFATDASATHLIARRLGASGEPVSPREPAAAAALLRTTGGGGDAYLEQLAVAPGGTAQRSLCAGAVIARALSDAAAAGRARLVAPAQTHAQEAAAWFAAAGMEEEKGTGWVRRIQ